MRAGAPRPRLSRRAFITVLFGGATVVAAGGWRARHTIRRSVERYYRGLIAFPGDSPPGPLNENTAATLRAVATTLLPVGVALTRYEEQFHWRATHRAGYRELYDRFAAALDRIAREHGQSDFVSSATAAQQQVLDRLASIRRVLIEQNLRGALRIALFERDWLLFERYITRDAIALFSYTDAWLLAGYPSHPGMPRGLESYRQPVAPVS